MSDHRLVVGLGDRRYRVERPWGDLPHDAGRVSDVTVDSRGHVFVLLRYDPLVDAPGTPVVELDRDGVRVNAWGAELIADSHMLACSDDDRLHIVDRDAHEIIICSAEGERLGGIGQRHRPLAPFNHPTDVAFAPSGDIYVSDGYANSKVHRFNNDGTAIGSWGALGRGRGEFMNPHAIWVLRTGASSSSIARMTGCRCSRRAGICSMSGAASNSPSTSGATPGAICSSRIWCPRSACCHMTERCWGAAGRSSTGRTAYGATRTEISF